MEVTATFETTGLFADGFESGDFSQWTGVSTTSGETATVVSNVLYDGSYGARFTTNGGGGTERAYIYKNIDPQSELYVRTYVNIADGLPLDADTNRFNLISFMNGATILANMGVIRNNGVDVWDIYSSVGIFYANSGPSMDQWYCVEFYIKTDPDLADQATLSVWVDGQLILTQTGLNIGGTVNSVRTELVFVSGITHTLDVYSDNIVISNNYIGPESTNNVPVVGGVALWSFSDVVWVSQGGSVAQGDVIRILAYVSGAVEPVSISYGPSGGSLTTVTALQHSVWGYYYIDLTIPSGATLGLYDVRVDSGVTTSTASGVFNVVASG
jgi:hypothetical protein